MKVTWILLIASIFSVISYDRNAAVNYAKAHWNKPNHKCGNYIKCTPYSYWGGEACGYSSQGGDCANFVSQILLAGGHAKLKGGECRGYPCGVEEIGALKLGKCLANQFKWKRTCGYLQKPPSNIQPGDVLVYHSGSCDGGQAHAVAVVSVGGGSATIACHSNANYNVAYTYMGTSMPYYEWLHLG